MLMICYKRNFFRIFNSGGNVAKGKKIGLQSRWSFLQINKKFNNHEINYLLLKRFYEERGAFKKRILLEEVE